MDLQKTETEPANTTAAAPEAPDQALQNIAMPIKAEAGQNAVVEAPKEEAEPAATLQPEGHVATVPATPKKPAKAPRSASSLPVAGIVMATLVLLALVGLAYMAYTKKG